MGAIVVGGPTVWGGSRDNEGHREYNVSHRVWTDDIRYGPATVMNAVGLPRIGAMWSFGLDLDVWAWCQPDMTVKSLVDGEGNFYWVVDQKFSTKPRERKKCADESIEDPLLEPAKVSGGFTKKTEEVMYDQNGPITNSAYELLRGPQVEFDAGAPTIKIEQNVPTLQLDVLAQLIHTVNMDTLWGIAARCIKLSNITWEKVYYGECYVYYKRSLEFEVNWNTWDRYALDEGTKALNGHWGRNATEGYGWVLDNIGGEVPNPENPRHYSRYKDRKGENTKVILNGAGIPWDPDLTGTNNPASIMGRKFISYYEGGNFLVLGIPVTF